MNYGKALFSMMLGAALLTAPALAKGGGNHGSQQGQQGQQGQDQSADQRHLEKYSAMLDELRKNPASKAKFVQELQTKMQQHNLADANNRLAVCSKIFDNAIKLDANTYKTNRTAMARQIMTQLGQGQGNTGGQHGGGNGGQKNGGGGGN